MIKKGFWLNGKSETLIEVTAVTGIEDTRSKFKYRCWSFGGDGKPHLHSNHVFHGVIIKKNYGQWKKVNKDKLVSRQKRNLTRAKVALFVCISALLVLVLSR